MRQFHVWLYMYMEPALAGSILISFRWTKFRYSIRKIAIYYELDQSGKGLLKSEIGNRPLRKKTYGSPTGWVVAQVWRPHGARTCSARVRAKKHTTEIYPGATGVFSE